jgi:HEAT repeat protein
MTDCNLTSLHATRVCTICAQLHHAYRDVRFYPSGHPTAQTTVTRFAQLLSEQVEMEGLLALEVREDRLLFDDHEVYFHPETRDNLAFLLFREGVRTLTFQSGLESHEVEAFVGCLARADDLVRSEQDLLTVLWEADFAHIDYQAADPFLGGSVLREGTVEELRRTVLKRLDEADISQMEAGPEGTGKMEVVGRAGTESEELTLTPDERDECKRHQGVAASALDDFTLVFLEMVSDLAHPLGDDVIIPWLRMIVQSYADAGNIAALNLILSEFESKSTGGRSGGRWLSDVLAQVFTGQMLGVLLQDLETASTAESADLERFLDSLPASLCPVLLEVLAESDDKSVRKALLRALDQQSNLSPVKLVPLLQDERWYVLRNGLQLAASSGDSALVPFINRLASHEDVRVRRAAVRALDGIGGAQALVGLTAALEDGDAGVRMAAIRGCVRHGGVEQELAVIRQVKRRDFSLRSGEEVEAALLALVSLAGDRATPVLGDLCRRRVVFRRRPAVRAAALRTLRVMQSKSAVSSTARSFEPADAEAPLASEYALKGRRP